MKGRIDGVAVAMVLGVVGVVLAVLAGIGFGVANALHEEVRTCTVEQKERIYAGKDAGVQQRVYTEECGVLSVGDALFAGHFRSADTWRSIEEGHTYEMTTRGYRVGFFSMFPNVIKAEEVSK
jgi:hypothetical protein